MTAKHRHTTRRRLLASALALSLVAAACGDDDSTEDSSTTTGDTTASTEPEQPEPTDAPEEATTTEPEDTAAEPEPEPEPEPESTEAPEESTEPTGEPVTVWVIEDSSEAAGVTVPSVRAGIDARVARINSDGGLGAAGHPVQVEVCVTDFDPNAAAQCARDAAADPTAIAVAASVTGNGDAYLPILEEAGLANVGTTAFAQADSTSPVSFPTMGGLIAATGCQATILRDQAGVTNFGVARGDSPGSDQVGVLLTVLGIPAGAEVVTPLANTDYTAEVSALAADVDGIVLAQDFSTAIKTLRAIDQLGIDLPLAGSAGQSWTQENMAAGGPAVEGMYVALWYAADDSGEPGVEQYLADLDAIGALDLTDDLAKLGWVAFELIDQVAADADVVDRTVILDGLNQMSAFDTGGMTPVLDFTTPGGLFGGAAPRFVNESCAYGQVQDGVIVGVGGLITPFSG